MNNLHIPVRISKVKVKKATIEWLYETNLVRKKRLLILILLHSTPSVAEVAKKMLIEEKEVLEALQELKGL